MWDVLVVQHSLFKNYEYFLEFECFGCFIVATQYCCCITLRIHMNTIIATVHYVLLWTTQDKVTQISFCGAKDHKYPDPRGMGYPFNKTWDRRMNSTAPVREIIKDLPHTMITDFVIYRSTKLYQGSTDDSDLHPSHDITWENTIKGFFTERDVNCMSGKFNLTDKGSVAANAPLIYGVVKSGKMPKGENRWSNEKVSTFNAWMVSGCP